MTVDEVATFLKVSRSAVDRLLSGEACLPSFRVGSSVRLFRDDVLRWAFDGGTPKRPPLRPSPRNDVSDWRR